MSMVLVTVALCLLFGAFLFISQLNKKSKPDDAKSVAVKSTHKNSSEWDQDRANSLSDEDEDENKLIVGNPIFCIATIVLCCVFPEKEPNTYTRSEISMHNKGTDCWIIIKDKVYDVTSYVEEHPGGDAILDHAGDDSTEGFFGPQHATRVFDMIDEFYIGDLKQ